jgi:hypothetical protein
LREKVKKKFFDYIWSFLKGKISEDLKRFVSEVVAVLIHDPEKVYKDLVATCNTLRWWLHSLSFIITANLSVASL